MHKAGCNHATFPGHIPFSGGSLRVFSKTLLWPREPVFNTLGFEDPPSGSIELFRSEIGHPAADARRNGTETFFHLTQEKSHLALHKALLESLSHSLANRTITL